MELTIDKNKLPKDATVSLCDGRTAVVIGKDARGQPLCVETRVTADGGLQWRVNGGEWMELKI